LATNPYFSAIDAELVKLPLDDREPKRLYASVGGAKVSVVDVRDIAEVAVAALTETGHEGKIYDLTGPQALTHAVMAERLPS